MSRSEPSLSKTPARHIGFFRLCLQRHFSWVGLMYRILFSLLFASLCFVGVGQAQTPTVPESAAGQDTESNDSSPAESEATSEVTTRSEAPSVGDSAETPASPSEDAQSSTDPSAMPSVPEPPNAASRPPSGLRADVSCASGASERARRSVVRVRSGNVWGAGFFFGRPDRVITSFRNVRLGRGARVVTADGQSTDARVIAHDEDYDLAVLALDEELDGAPLVAAPAEQPVVGQPVASIGHPFASVATMLGPRGEGLLRWSSVTGHVSAVNSVGIQVGMALNAGYAGSPLLNCAGQVMGMVTGAGVLGSNIGLVARTSVFESLVRQGEDEFMGAFRGAFGLGFALRFDQSGSAVSGVYGTVGGILFDRVSLLTRVGVFFGGVQAPGPDVLNVDRTLVRIEPLLGYRFFFDLGGFSTLYVVPSAGLTVSYDERSTRSVSVVPDCVATEMNSCIRFTETGSSDWTVRPALSLAMYLGNFEFGYTFELDVETEPLETLHTLRAGFLF